MELAEAIYRDIEFMKSLKEGAPQRRGKSLVVYKLVDIIPNSNNSPGMGYLIDYIDPSTPIIGVSIRKDVPPDFRPPVIAHELTAFNTRSPEFAIYYEMKFARKFFSKRKFNEYVEWSRKVLPDYLTEAYETIPRMRKLAKLEVW